MKIQDLHPYDKVVVGLNDLYIIDSDGNFYINSPAIIAADKTICTGKTYLLINSSKSNGVKMYSIELMDVYYEDSVVNLIVRDTISQHVFKIDQCIECARTQCKWALIDLSYYNKLMNAKAIRQYCQKCADSEKEPIGEGKTKFNEDLLQFEF
jgi:hypothetical protein